MYDWLIVGGGIQGCTLATFLIKSGKTTIDKLAIIDPHRSPLENWIKCTHNIGMEHLRSPSVHHIDVEPFSLQHYAQNINTKTVFRGRYKRPSLELFNEHCKETLNEVSLYKSWFRDRVNKIKKYKKDWIVETNNNNVFISKNVVLSMGISEKLYLPDWAHQLKQDAPRNIYHIFDKKLTNIDSLPPPISIVGGGITAAHLAIKTSALFPGRVTLIKRHPFRIHDFDSDPGWLGPKNLYSFNKVDDFNKRRDLIKKARYKGSLTKELYFKLLHLQKKGLLTIINSEVTQASTSRKNLINLYLANEEIIQTNTLLLATGFNQAFPKEDWLQSLIKENDLSCASCGYPIVQHNLEWCPHLFVMGPLAELEIGPVARNISGARKAAERIIQSI